MKDKVAILLEPTFDKVFSTQEIYRLLLDTMARPGRIRNLPRLPLNPPAGLSTAAAAVAFTLLDSAAGFSLLPANQPAADYIRVNTAAPVLAPDQAEFIILDGKLPLDISRISCGSLLSPEQGATLIIMAENLADASERGVKLKLTGPGIEHSRLLAVSGLHPDLVRQMQQMNGEFPLGVDSILSDEAGRVASIPRSTIIEWEAAGSWDM